MYFSTRNLSVRYDRVRAVNDLSIEVDEGEIVALIGANGAGKSSTLRAITGLVRPAAGEIHYDGQRIDAKKPAEIVAAGVSMVPEGRRIFPLMSVRDNLLMGAFRRDDKVRIQEDLERCYQRFPRIKERLRQQGSTLSGGEQQMVVMSRALMSRPRLLLLDEPSLGLAPQLVREIARAIVEINRDDGVSVILVEQNSKMALRISHRTYVLEMGRVALDGRSPELAENPHIKRIYLGG